MRFCRLDLIRYGKFTDFSIDLPAPDASGKPDFHLIVGANEAGKSTTRHAITDLLFGFERQTRFDFIHDKKDMCLGGMLEAGSSQLEFHRLKRNSQPLRSPDGAELPDDALTPFTGNADRLSFLREFCLDHAGLETGGKNLMDSGNDVGRMLFEASAGVGIFGDFLDRLEEESSSLWTKGRSRSHEFYQAHDAFEQAKAMLKEATAKTTEWKSVNQKVDLASEALNEALNEYATLEQTRTRLDRVRRVAPHLQARNIKIEECSALGEVITLPETAGDDLRTAKDDIDEAEKQTRKYEALIDKATKDRDSVILNTALLSRKDNIDELREEKSRIKNHSSDIAKREAESQVLSDEINGLVRDLEWPMSDHESLDGALPSSILRKEIEGLANSFSGLNQAATNATENLKERDRDFAALTKEFDELPDKQLPSDIATSLKAARELGNTEATKAEISERIRSATGTYDIHVAKLRPWTGSAEELRKLAVPSDSEVQEFKNSERDLIVELKAAKEHREKIISEINADELKEKQLRKDANPITHEDIEISRQKRDHFWDGIKSGTKPIKEVGDKFEAHITASDDLVDNRYRKAEDAKELKLLRNTISEHKLDCDGADRSIADIEGQQSVLLINWRLVIDKLGLGDMGISAFQTWLGHYRSALNEAEKLTDEQAQIQGLESREAMAATNLRQAFSQVDSSEEATSQLTIQQLIDRAESDVSTDELSGSRREQLQREIQQETLTIEGMKEKETDANQALETWETSWAKKIKACRLPDAITPETALTALSLMTDLKEKLDRNRDIKQNRIMTMQRDIENFKQNTDALMLTIASDLSENSAEEICTTLSQRLNDAEKAQETYEKALIELEENQEHLEAAQTLISEANLSLAPYMERAKTSSINDLEAVIEKSENSRNITREIEDLTAIILENSDGLSMDEVEAEIAIEDISTINVRLTEINEQREQALERRDECRSALKDAEQERDKIHGQADAASAEAQRQGALARMADVTQRFIKVHMGAQLLRWSIERYRDEKRGPLLERASEIFSILTLGSFKTLQIDYEGDTPRLMGCRPDGKHVDFEGLSDGTGDQLFLSLRLAAVENQLEHAQPLPFIADDLFINYDDDRAAQGFKALGELAAKSQVIYFTHHEHLIDVAQKAICEDLSVTRL